MFELLFCCNFVCNGCGKIDYLDLILNQCLFVEECLQVVDECGVFVVLIVGGELLFYKEMLEIVKGIMKCKKFVYLCMNVFLMEKKMDDYQLSLYFVWLVYFDGDKDMYDYFVLQEGVYDKVVVVIKEVKCCGFCVNINCMLFNDVIFECVVKFFDMLGLIGVDGIIVLLGYVYECVLDQQYFLNCDKMKNLFCEILKCGEGGKCWLFSQLLLFFDFLVGNQMYKCMLWGNLVCMVFGWQKLCYLVGEGYVKIFKELMEMMEWDNYGVGNYEKCVDCMVYCGFEVMVVMDMILNLLKVLCVSCKGIKIDGLFVLDILIVKQCLVEYVFLCYVEIKFEEIQCVGKGKLQKLVKLVMVV